MIIGPPTCDISGLLLLDLTAIMTTGTVTITRPAIVSQCWSTWVSWFLIGSCHCTTRSEISQFLDKNVTWMEALKLNHAVSSFCGTLVLEEHLCSIVRKNKVESWCCLNLEGTLSSNHDDEIFIPRNKYLLFATNGSHIRSARMVKEWQALVTTKKHWQETEKWRRFDLFYYVLNRVKCQKNVLANLSIF